MTVRREHRDCRVQLVLLDKQVVGVVRGNGENADSGICERRRQRGENTGHRKRQRPLHLETSPSRLVKGVFGNKSLGTHDRKLVIGSRNAKELSVRPRRHGIPRCVPANRKGLGEDLQGQSLHISYCLRCGRIVEGRHDAAEREPETMTAFA